MEDFPHTLERTILMLAERLSDIERRMSNRRRTGVIDEVDYSTGKYRVKISENDGVPVRTGWIRPRTLAAGGVKLDINYTIGEQVDVVSESGDMTDAMIDFSTYSDANARENTVTPVHLKVTGNVTVIASGDVLAEVGGNVTATVAGNMTSTVGGHYDLTAGSGHLH